MIQTLETGLSVQNRKIELLSLNGYSKSRKNILLMACVHGNEKEGFYCVERILENVSSYHFNPNYNFLCIPCFNPDGFALDTRDNANGVNLNRNMPTKDWISGLSAQKEKYANFFGGKSAGSEPETQFLLKIYEKYKPVFILSLHSPLKLIDYNGPAKVIAEKLSVLSGFPVGPVGYPTPGSHGTWFGHERNVPVITYEFISGKIKKEWETIWKDHERMFRWIFEEMDLDSLNGDE